MWILSVYDNGFLVDILYVLSYQEMGSCNTYTHTKHNLAMPSMYCPK